MFNNLLTINNKPGHRAEDAQDVVRVPAHAAQGIRRQFGERHAQGQHHRRRAGEHQHVHRHADHRAMKEGERIGNFIRSVSVLKSSFCMKMGCHF